jgi:hypothetical protein
MICQHKQLQRQCELCDKDAEIERLTALFEATRFDKRQHAEALDEIERLKAKIDALMLEFCPDEMTPEQVEQWGENQKPAALAGKEPKP